MPLSQGSRLGPYEIVAPLGAGGMGEVYRARDTRLERLVAIKVLPDQLAADPELRERFEREARAISSLNHPHICVLYDVGRHDDIDFLVLELLEGRTLADRLLEGPLPLPEALRTAIQVGNALDRAHRSGLTHRDLKPANVMLTKSGAKLLDFGLAKPSAPAGVLAGISTLPTTPPNVTTQGAIIGTFQYMAPEQIEGLESDARTDIFAFGALLFEMLTGRAPFQGKTRASLLGAILKDDVPAISSVQPTAPKALDRIATRCLAKDPDDRWQSVRDIVHELEWVAGGGGQESAVAQPRPKMPMAWLGWALAALVAIAFAASGALNRARATLPTDVVQFSVSPPEGATFAAPTGGGTGVAAQVSISPDGRTVVFVANTGGTFKLWVRALDATEPRELPGTEGGTFPFWSPDSRTIGFFASGKMKKVPAVGGPVITLCDATAGRGGTWSADNVIVFAPSVAGPLMRISAAGGEPVPVSSLDASYGESSHRFPQFLPDGKRFLFTAVVGTCCPPLKPGRVKIGTLGTTDATEILRLDDSIAFFASGHLLFTRENTLMAQPFDAVSGRLSGDVFPVVEGVGNEGSRFITAAASQTGVLVYGHGRLSPNGRLVWIDRSGRQLGSLGKRGVYSSLALAPDEKRVAVTSTTGNPPNRDIWILDATTGADVRLTFNPEVDHSPIWSPDGRRIAFTGAREGRLTLRVQDATKTGGDDALLEKSISSSVLLGAVVPNDWSPDGRHLIFSRSPGTRGSVDLWARPMSGDAAPFPLFETAAIEEHGVIAPNGRWIAYSSSETGVSQVFVAPFPPAPGRYMVSRDGGVMPHWRADGKELFFLALDSKLMSAAVTATDRFEGAAPQALFPTTIPGTAVGRQYAPVRNGSRFLVNMIERESETTPLTVVVNWLAAVQK